MELSLKNLAIAIKAEVLRGDEHAILGGVANLSDATPLQLAPFTSDGYLEQLKTTRAGAVLAGRGIDPAAVPAATALLQCDDPEMAFLDALNLFHGSEKPRPGIHSSAQIDPTAKLGANVFVGPNVVIEAQTVIGDECQILAGAAIGPSCEIGGHCVIHRNAVLYERSKLGHRVVLHAGAVIGADGFGYKFRGGQHVKVPHVGWVEISDDVEIGANSCIDRGTLGPTRIGAGTKIDNLVQIAHNNNVGKHCIICGQVALAGSCTLEDFVVLAGNVGLADHTKMGRGSKAGAKSGVMGHIAPGKEVWGLIATESRSALKSQAALRRLPELEKRVKELERQLKK